MFLYVRTPHTQSALLSLKKYIFLIIHTGSLKNTNIDIFFYESEVRRGAKKISLKNDDSMLTFSEKIGLNWTN